MEVFDAESRRRDELEGCLGGVMDVYIYPGQMETSGQEYHTTKVHDLQGPKIWITV